MINPFDGVEVVGKVDGAEKEQNRKDGSPLHSRFLPEAWCRLWENLRKRAYFAYFACDFLCALFVCTFCVHFVWPSTCHKTAPQF